MDQDGDGEIRHIEATKFLDSIRNRETKSKNYDYRETKDGTNDFFFPHSSGFSYGGTTICAEEMLDHLQNMLTSDRVADWIAHGLELPQYAKAFQEKAVNGLDFPTIIDKEGLALTQELGVHSTLHHKKITLALVWQIFGLGTFPGPPQNLSCEVSTCNGVLLHWKPPPSSGYPPLHKYVVQRWDNGCSKWISRVNGTKENSFVDRIEKHHNRSYSYRVRAWGGHGPSEWVMLHGCTPSRSQALVDSCLEQHAFYEDYTPTSIQTKQDAVEVLNAAAVVTSLPSNHGVSIANTLCWVYFVNGGIVVLGILSRNRYFFRYMVSIWTLLEIKILRGVICGLFEAQSINFAVVKKLSHNLCSTWAKHMPMCPPKCKLWQSKQHDISADFPVLDCSLEEENPAISKKQRRASFSDASVILEEHEGIGTMKSRLATGSNWGANGRVMSADTLLHLNNICSGSSSLQLQEQHGPCCMSAPATVTRHWVGSIDVRNHDEYAEQESARLVSLSHDHDDIKSGLPHLQDSAKSTRKSRIKLIHMFGGSFRGHERSHNPRQVSKQPFDVRCASFSSRWGKVSGIPTASEREITRDETWRASESFRLPSSAWSQSLRQGRYMCNFKGCNSRFDRLLSASDWRMKFSKHYCCQCQLLYCVKHTHISPHGLLGRCGLDSICVCKGCFEGISFEMRERLETLNKFPSGPLHRLISLMKSRRQKRKAGDFMHADELAADMDRRDSMLFDGNARPSPSTSNAEEHNNGASSTSSQSSSLKDFHL